MSCSMFLTVRLSSIQFKPSRTPETSKIVIPKLFSPTPHFSYAHRMPGADLVSVAMGPGDVYLATRLRRRVGQTDLQGPRHKHSLGFGFIYIYISDSISRKLM